MSIIVRPKSRFLEVECPRCGEKHIVFDHSAMEVKCSNCGEPLVLSKAGKAEIKAKVLRVLG